jgi:hypothetical protein
LYLKTETLNVDATDSSHHHHHHQSSRAMVQPGDNIDRQIKTTSVMKQRH